MRKVEDEIMRNYRIVRNAEKEFIKEIADSHDPEEVKHRLKECIKAFHHPDNPEEAVLNACDHLTHEEMQAAAKLIALPEFPLKELMNLDMKELKKPAKGWDVKRIGAVFLALALIVGGGLAQTTGKIAAQNWPTHIQDWSQTNALAKWLSWGEKKGQEGEEDGGEGGGEKQEKEGEKPADPLATRVDKHGKLDNFSKPANESWANTLQDAWVDKDNDSSQGNPDEVPM